MELLEIVHRVREIAFAAANLRGTPADSETPGTEKPRATPGHEDLSPALSLERLLDRAPIGVIAIDRDCHVVAWNRRTSEILDRSEHEALGADLRTLVPELGNLENVRPVERAPDAPSVAGTTIFERTRSDGRPQYIEAAASPLDDHDRGPLALFSLLDVTERVEAERTLRESEARYRSLVETAGDVILCLDPKFRILEWNRAAEALYGYERHEILGHDYLERCLPPEARRPVASEIRKILSGTPTERFENPVQTRSGEMRDMLWNSTRLLDARGDTVGLVAIGHDITEQKRAERVLKERTQQLERSNRDLEEFTSIASHDLQEPLRQLVAFSELLGEDAGTALPEAALRDLEFITDAATRMQKLVRDLLALSHIGAEASDRETTDLGDCIDRALEALDLRVRETGARITRDSLPSLQVNPTLLTELYQNLLSNALKFVDDAPPHIHLSAEHDGEHWVLGVRDDGIGIPADQHEEVFKVFRRLHSRATYEGTGIGLAICRRAVERHGGRIWVESAPGVGSHFKFVLDS